MFCSICFRISIVKVPCAVLCVLLRCCHCRTMAYRSSLEHVLHFQRWVSSILRVLCVSRLWKRDYWLSVYNSNLRSVDGFVSKQLKGCDRLHCSSIISFVRPLHLSDWHFKDSELKLRRRWALLLLYVLHIYIYIYTYFIGSSPRGFSESNYITQVKPIVSTLLSCRWISFVFVAVLQTVKLVDGCQWSDNLVELQMWSRLSVLAFNAENHSLVLHCGQRAVAFAESDKCLAKRQPKKPDKYAEFNSNKSVFLYWINVHE